MDKQLITEMVKNVREKKLFEAKKLLKEIYKEKRQEKYNRIKSTIKI